MHTRAMFVRWFVALATIAALSSSPAAQFLPPLLPPPPGPPSWLAKLDPILQQRLSLFSGSSLVIVRAVNASSLGSVVSLIQQAGATLGRPLPIIDGRAARVPNLSLPILASSPLVLHVSLDRLVVGAMERTGATIGATAVRQELGYTGAGVGVAIIDSGVTSWHDDLADPSGGTQRVARFVDFVNGAQAPYDDYGHGSHVAGIVAGNGFDSSGARSGIAPAAHLVVLKTLDATGRGRISDVIAALDFVVSSKDAYNIRVVNMSVAAGVSESYNTDPLTLAAKRAVSSGIVVVAAAGNAGRNAQGHTQYGGITAPGNAPWVLTAGASSHMGTPDRADDTIAAFSSRGPSPIDYAAKPDLVAPGVGIESLSDPQGAMYTSHSAYLLSGTVPTPSLPYLSLSGTSMAAPVVAGTVALMLEANPALTPNAVKAILQYTAQPYAGYNALTQGAGFLNAKGAVDLAQFFTAPANTVYPSSAAWGAQIIWGHQLAQGGQLRAAVNAWYTDVIWGATTAPGGQLVEWGVICAATNCGTDGPWAPWRAGTWGSIFHNILWGTTCGGADCLGTWSTSYSDGVVWGTTDSDGVVWGTTDSDGVVWGTNDNAGVVWGTNDNDGVVWGTDDSAGVVWGTNSNDGVVWGTNCTDPSCQPVVWTQ